MRRVYETNVFGPLSVVQAAAPGMIRRRSGLIVNVASIVGAVATPWAGFYTSSKAAVINFSDCLRLELAPFGVRVVTLNPGAVQSRIVANTEPLLAKMLAGLDLYRPFSHKIAERASLSQASGSTPTQVFASGVVDTLLGKSPPAEIWAGHMSGAFKLIRGLPIWARDALWRRRFGLSATLPPAGPASAAAAGPG